MEKCKVLKAWTSGFSDQRARWRCGLLCDSSDDGQLPIVIMVAAEHSHAGCLCSTVSIPLSFVSFCFQSPSASMQVQTSSPLSHAQQSALEVISLVFSTEAAAASGNTGDLGTSHLDPAPFPASNHRGRGRGPTGKLPSPLCPDPLHMLMLMFSGCVTYVMVHDSIERSHQQKGTLCYWAEPCFRCSP